MSHVIQITGPRIEVFRDTVTFCEDEISKEQLKKLLTRARGGRKCRCAFNCDVIYKWHEKKGEIIIKSKEGEEYSISRTALSRLKQWIKEK